MKENPLFFSFFLWYLREPRVDTRPDRKTDPPKSFASSLSKTMYTHLQYFCLTEYKNGAWISNLGEFSSDWEEKEDEDGESVQSRTS